MEVFTDPTTGRPYVFDPVSGRSRWLDQPPPPPLQDTQELPVVRRTAGRRVPRLGTFEDRGSGRRPRRGLGGRLARALGIAVVVVVLVSAFLVVVSRSLGDPGGTSGAAPGGSASSGASEPRVPRVGDAVRDGKFEFRVTGTRTAGRLGNDWINTTPDGRFFLVSVTVRNISDEGKTFVSIAQTLYDSQGHDYTADPRATLYLWQLDNLVDRMDPGDTVRGTIVFDLPVGAKPARVELHDSLFSGGVDVRLT